jgi:hypothetical protein
MRLILSDNDGSVLDLWDGDDLDAETIAAIYAVFGINVNIPAVVAAALAAEGA